MTSIFDQVIDRRSSDSVKWNFFDEDVLPMWVADMDFRVAEPIVRALQDRVAHGVFGYRRPAHDLCEVIAERMLRLYGWKVHAEEVVLFPGVITGFNLACQAFAGQGQGVLVQTPVYTPFLTAPTNAGAVLQPMQLTQEQDGRYSVDYDRFAATFDERTRVYLLCNPHNPVGRVYTGAELVRMAEICLERQVVICSDEIHSELVFNGHRHVPIASLSPEISQQTITLSSPSKAFNIPGLFCSYAVIQNPELRRKFQAARRGLVNEGNLLGIVAAEAAYRDGDDWLREVLVYLQANRDFLFEYVRSELPQLRMALPEGTYLAWLDCREIKVSQSSPCEFFIQQARVGMNDGSTFGAGGKNFVRLNFGCQRSILQEALERMKRAMESL